MRRVLTDSPGSRPLLLHPQRLTSRNQILAQSQGIHSYSSCTDPRTQHAHDDGDDDAKLFSRSHDDAADRPGARASPGSSSLGSSWGVSIGKSHHRTWKSDDARPANEAGGDDDDADAEPTGADERQPQ
jgi:hypothetical protein